jgi:hypothetical protein
VTHLPIRSLAAAALTRESGLSIELHHDSDSPARIVILWPPKPTKISPQPIALSEIARRVVRAFGDAQTELAKINKESGC